MENDCMDILKLILRLKMYKSEEEEENIFEQEPDIELVKMLNKIDKMHIS